MKIETIYSAEEITKLAKERFKEERSLNHLTGWFLAREIAMECDEKFREDPDTGGGDEADSADAGRVSSVCGDTG